MVVMNEIEQFDRQIGQEFGAEKVTIIGILKAVEIT